MNLKFSDKILEWVHINDVESVAHFQSHIDSQNIYAKSWKNSLTPKKIFIMSHDLCQYHGSFLKFINWALKEIPELEIIAMDFVGHGQSSGTRGHLNDFELVILDQLYLINSLNFHDGQEVFFLGQGVGASILIEVYNRFGNKLKIVPKGLVLSGLLVDLQKIQGGMNALIPESLLRFSNKIKALKYYGPLDFTNDREAAFNMESDPLMHFKPSYETLKEIKKRTQRVFQDSYFIERPILLAYGLMDPYLHQAGINFFMKGIKKELLLEKTYFHMKHDLYNEKDSEEFYLDIKNWIDQNV
jgi:hypothetical protein